MKIVQLVNAIINEDGNRLSAGSLRSLEMIKNEAYLLTQQRSDPSKNGSCATTGHDYQWVSELQTDVCVKCGRYA